MISNNNSIRSELLQLLLSFDHQWQDIISLPNLPEALSEKVVNMAMDWKGKLQRASECAEELSETNIRCMAKVLQLKQELYNITSKYDDLKVVSH